MKYNQFDKTIKDKLDGFEVPFDAAHWQQLEAALDNLEANDTSDKETAFDTLISSKLGGLSSDAAIPNWERMEAALNEVGIPNSTSDKETAFDTLISSKLGGLSSDKAMPNWERMEAALDEAGMSTDTFDKEVKSKINAINPVYQPNHWELLADRLRTEKAIKETLFKNKIAEVTIILLLLINFYHYFPNFNTVKSLPILPENIDKKPIKEKSSSRPEIAALNDEKRPSVLVKDRNIISTPQKKLLVESQPIKAISANTIADNINIVSIQTDNRLFIPPILNTIAVLGVSSRNKLQGIPLGIDGKTGLTIPVAEMNKHLDYLGLNKNSFVEPLPSLLPDGLTATIFTPLDCETCKQVKIPAQFRFGMLAHAGWTSAVRSASQILNTKTLTQRGSGYGSGFTLGFKYGRYEIETGLIYASKSYAPNINDAYESNSGINLKQFKGINLQTIVIPLNLRYNFAVLGSGKWHLYAQNGIAMNAILRAEYDIVSRSVSRSATNNKPTGITIASASRLSRIEYNQGILGGSRFKENRFFTVNIGIGAEYYLSPKWSIFVQPDFNYYISQLRIGPTEDRINSVSASFGIRASFH